MPFMTSRSGVELSKAIEEALGQACEALSLIVESRFHPREISVSYHDPLKLPALWTSGGSQAVCAAFYEVRGDLTGYLLLVFPFTDVDVLIRALLGEVGGDEEMVDSAVGEVGNIVGSAFLNHLADRYRMFIAPSPPQVVRDMMGALLQSLAAVAAAEGKLTVPVIRTAFAQEQESITAFLLWITDVEAIRRLENA